MPRRSDAYGINFPSGLDDSTLITFKTSLEKSNQVGREYNYGPQDVGSCKVVADEQSAGGGAKEGQIIFMKIGPINLMPYINDY